MTKFVSFEIFVTATYITDICCNTGTVIFTETAKFDGHSNILTYNPLVSSLLHVIVISISMERYFEGQGKHAKSIYTVNRRLVM